MTGEDLYKEEQCSQCGQKKLESASFCPHCGYVKKKSWVEKLGEVFSGSRRTDTGKRKRGLGFSTLLGLGFAGYLIYSAIEDESIQGIIIAALILFATLQSWYAAKKRGEKRPEGDVSGMEGDQEREGGPLEDKFFCENCSTRVDAGASECPKCGMKFG